MSEEDAGGKGKGIGWSVGNSTRAFKAFSTSGSSPTTDVGRSSNQAQIGVSGKSGYFMTREQQTGRTQGLATKNASITSSSSSNFVYTKDGE